jgi:hypothetical protein
MKCSATKQKVTSTWGEDASGASIQSGKEELFFSSHHLFKYQVRNTNIFIVFFLIKYQVINYKKERIITI